MNEAFKRRLVGLLTLATLALVLSWLLPRPGLRKLEGTDERVAAMDLTKPGSPAQEILPASPEDARVPGTKPKGAERSTLFPLPADPNAPNLDAAAEEEPAPDAAAATSPARPEQTADKTVAESIAAERAAAEKPAVEKVAAEKAAAAKVAADKAAADKAAADKATAERLAAQKAAVEKATAASPASTTAAVPAPAPAPGATTASTPPAPPPTGATAPAAPKPAAAANTTTAAAPAKPAGTWYAQCGVYSLLENAQSLRDDLARRGMSCDMAPVDSPKGSVYRVRCGPFKTRGEAEIVVSRIRDRVQAIVVDGAR